MDFTFCCIRDELRAMEARLLAVIDGCGGGWERPVANSEWCAAVPVLADAYAGDGYVLDSVDAAYSYSDDLGDGPVFDTYVDEELFVDPVFDDAPDSSHAAVPLLEFTVFNEEYTVDEPLFDEGLVYADEPLFDDGPVFDHETDIPFPARLGAVLDEEYEHEEAELIPYQFVVIGPNVATPATFINTPSTCSTKFPILAVDTTAWDNVLGLLLLRPVYGAAAVPKLEMRSVLCDGFASEHWDPGVAGGSEFLVLSKSRADLNWDPGASEDATVTRFGVHFRYGADFNWGPGSIEGLQSLGFIELTASDSGSQFAKLPWVLSVLFLQQKCGGTEDMGVIATSNMDLAEICLVPMLNDMSRLQHSCQFHMWQFISTIELTQVIYLCNETIFLWGYQWKMFWTACVVKMFKPRNPKYSECFLHGMRLEGTTMVALQCIDFVMLIWIFSSMGGLLLSCCMLTLFQIPCIVICYVTTFGTGQGTKNSNYQTRNQTWAEMAGLQGNIGTMVIDVSSRSDIVVYAPLDDDDAVDNKGQILNPFLLEFNSLQRNIGRIVDYALLCGSQLLNITCVLRDCKLFPAFQLFLHHFVASLLSVHCTVAIVLQHAVVISLETVAGVLILLCYLRQVKLSAVPMQGDKFPKSMCIRNFIQGTMPILFYSGSSYSVVTSADKCDSSSLLSQSLRVYMATGA